RRGRGRARDRARGGRGAPGRRRGRRRARLHGDPVAAGRGERRGGSRQPAGLAGRGDRALRDRRGARRRRGGRAVNRRGFGLIEILIVVAVVALAGYFVMQYVGSTARSVETLKKERPIDRSRLAADRATLATLQGLVRAYQAEKGQWPPDK